MADGPSENDSRCTLSRANLTGETWKNSVANNQQSTGQKNNMKRKAQQFTLPGEQDTFGLRGEVAVQEAPTPRAEKPDTGTLSLFRNEMDELPEMQDCQSCGKTFQDRELQDGFCKTCREEA